MQYISSHFLFLHPFFLFPVGPFLFNFFFLFTLLQNFLPLFLFSYFFLSSFLWLFLHFLPFTSVLVTPFSQSFTSSSNISLWPFVSIWPLIPLFSFLPLSSFSSLFLLRPYLTSTKRLNLIPHVVPSPHFHFVFSCHPHLPVDLSFLCPNFLSCILPPSSCHLPVI